MNDLGARVYGLAAMMMGAAGLLWGDFAIGGMKVPDTLPGRVALAYAAGVLLLTGGLLINVRRAWGAGLLTAVLTVAFILVDLPRLAMHALTFAYWEAAAVPLGVTMGGLIAFAAATGTKASPRLVRLDIGIFAVCLFVYGAAHFVFAAFSAPFVPKWLPPSQLFWVYLTGVAAIAAGLALLSGVRALLAARLLTLMYILFGILVHVPTVWATPANHHAWVEFISNFALAGAAWIVADVLAAAQAPISAFQSSRAIS